MLEPGLLDEFGSQGNPITVSQTAPDTPYKETVLTYGATYKGGRTTSYLGEALLLPVPIATGTSFYSADRFPFVP